MKNNQSISESFAFITYTMLVIFLYFVIRAIVLQKLWLWLAVPIFGIQPIIFSHALALVLLLKFCVQNTSSEERKEKSLADKYARVNRVLAGVIVFSLSSLFWGFLLKSFI